MEGMFSYTQAAMERTMKVQEVILRAMAKKITWWQAAEIIGISDRQMRRWHERYEEFGVRGLFDRRRGKPSPKKVPLAVVEKVLGLYREKYFDLNVRHFHEKLQAEHQVEISYSWVKGLLQGAGMVAKGRKRGVHRKLRPRRPLPGMLLHIDGSEHRWFQDERWYDLLVIMDDANSEIYYAQLVEEEATVPVLLERAASWPLYDAATICALVKTCPKNQSCPILALAPSRYSMDRMEPGERRIVMATSGKGWTAIRSNSLCCVRSGH